jgi:hypothetical protein
MNNIDSCLGMLERLEVIPEKDVKNICAKVAYLSYQGQINLSFLTEPCPS